MTANNSMCRNVDINSVMVGNILVKLSNSVRYHGFVIDIQLNLNEQINSVKRKVIVNLINIYRIAKFINKDSKMKLVHGLVFSIIDFCNSLYYGLPNVILNCLQMLINSAARTVVDLLRFSREMITPISVYLHILPIKTRIKYKTRLLPHKAIHTL